MSTDKRLQVDKRDGLNDIVQRSHSIFAMKQPLSVERTISDSKTAITLRIHFPETLVLEPASNVAATAAAPPPTLSLSAYAIEKSATKSGAKYLVISLDLDAPFPSFPILSPILHGIQADLVAGTVDENGFAPLEGPPNWQVMPYIGPGPPKLSAPHHYVFMVFEQPEGTDAAKIRSALGLEGRGTGLMPRMRWDQEAFERKLGLGDVVAGNFFFSRG